MDTVCHVITKLELGGAQQNTLFTVSHLNPAKFRPILIAGEPGLLDTEVRSFPTLEFYQVPALVRAIRPFHDVRALWELTRLFKRLQPTIVHTHSSKAGILGRMAAYFAGVPIIIHTIHGYGVTPAQRPLLRCLLLWAERLVSKKTTRFFSVSEANRRQGIEWNLFSPDQCVVIRSGVDIELLRNTSVDKLSKKRDLGLDPFRPLVGMVAPLKPQKAPLDFLRMAARVHQTNPEVQFVIVGDGEMRPAVERERSKLGLTHVLHLLGWRRDVPEILRCMNVFTLTSLWEGLPRVYLEALAIGVPVVGTRVDGAEEVVKDGVNGFLLEPGDVEGLARKVQQLLVHSEALPQSEGLGLGKEFDINEMVRRQEKEYQYLINALVQR